MVDIYEIPSIDISEDELKPKFGNLLDLLQKELQSEAQKLEAKSLPSQNDLSRLALKSAVFDFYNEFDSAPDTIVVNNLHDDRLSVEFAPDFDVIAKIWFDKLDELKRRKDKYMLIDEEFDQAQDDLVDGMRGSAFEKRLDRYRQDFMKILSK